MAQHEVQSRTLAKATQGFTVSDAELNASQERLERVRAQFSTRNPLAEIANGNDHGNGNNALLQGIDRLLAANTARLEANTARLEANMAGLRNEMQATMQRAESRQRNQAHVALREGAPPQLQALAKLRAGIGAGFRRRPRGQDPQLPEGFVGGEIGDACAYFPRSILELHGMNNARIYTLSVWYNEDFGIVGGDNLRTKRAKFLTWCMY